MSVNDDDEVHRFLSLLIKCFRFQCEEIFFAKANRYFNASYAVVETTCTLLACERKDCFK